MHFHLISRKSIFFLLANLYFYIAISSLQNCTIFEIFVGGQDSDVDSGIVAYGKPGQRIGSTSSADTDSSQESRRRIE